MSEESNNNQVPDPGPATRHLPLAAVFVRSFFMQAGWNYERFQNLGFAFAITPALRKIYGSGQALNAALLRHLGPFNTQPYMTGFVLGNIIGMEEELAGRAGDAGLEARLLGVKQAMASGFAAIGDRVFWGRLKPLTTQLCIVVWMLAGFYGWLFTGSVEQPSAPILFAGPCAGIAVYGAFTVYLRWAGLKRGIECRGRASCGLDAMRWPALIRTLSLVGFAFSVLLVAGAFVLLAARGLPADSKGSLALKVALVLGVMALQRLTRKFGRSILFAMAIIIAVSVALFAALQPGGPDLYL